MYRPTSHRPRLTAPTALLLLATIATFNAANLHASASASLPYPSCKPGRYFSASLHRCAVCSPGTYSWGGNFPRCLPCPKNTFTPFRGVVDKSLCLPCPPGHTSAPGSAACADRSSGKTSVPDRTVLCRGRVPKGSTRSTAYYIRPPAGVSYLHDSICVSPVTGCPRGTYLLKWARRAICARKRSGRVLCGKGRVFDGVDRCVSCAKGNFLKRVYGSGSGSDRKWRCELCPPASVSKGGLQKRCVTCRCGYAKSADGTRCVRTVPEGIKIKC